MTEPETSTAVATVHALNTAGRYRDALDHLDQLPDTGVFLWLRGVALYHLGRPQEAHDALRRARPLLTGNHLAQVLNDQAYFYALDRQFRYAIETYLLAAAAAVDDPVMQPLVTYNLGWMYLSRMELASAHEYLQAVLERGERGDVAERMQGRVGVSTLDRANGHFRAAAHRGRLATEVADGHRLGNLAFRTYGHALRQLGHLEAARQAQEQAVVRAIPDVYRANETLILGIIDVTMGRPSDLASLEEGALALDVTRSVLHRAELARQGQREGEMLRLLQLAIARDEPFALWDEAAQLPQLFAVGRSAGLALPYRPPPGHPAIRVEIGCVGVAALHVAGRPVAVPRSDISALTLLAYVVLEPAERRTTPEVLGALYDWSSPRSRASRLTRDLHTVNAWLGDPHALRVVNGVIVRSDAWAWAGDVTPDTVITARSDAVFLPRARGHWVDELRRAREDARAGNHMAEL